MADKFVEFRRQPSRTELKQQTIRDSLTGAYNRRYFDQQLNRLILSQNKEFSLIMFDIDHFKDFNDTFGHEGGDAALIRVVNIVRSRLRSDDKLCRIGGEEFCVIYNGTDKVVERAEDIKKAIEESHSNLVNKRINHVSDTQKITISVGVATHDKNSVFDRKELYEKADNAMYQAKQSGRNQVKMA